MHLEKEFVAEILYKEGDLVTFGFNFESPNMKKYTILVSFINAVGHANACFGALRPLLQRGHRIVVVLESAFKGKAAALGFEEFVYQVKSDEEKKLSEGKLGTNPGENLAKMLLEKKIIGPSTVYEKFENFAHIFQLEENVIEFAKQNDAVRDAIEKYKPDLIYYDSPRLVPVIYYSGIPVIKNISVVPSYFELDDELPPGGFGLPLNSDREEWKRITQKRRLLFEHPFFQKNQIEPLGYKAYPENTLFPEISCLTVYAYPEELNYPAIRKKGWFNLEVFNKIDPSKTELSKLVPEDFIANTLDGKFSGKLIYLSMGSMGSVDLSLMNRLVEILGATPHKYIVSKGPRHAEYSLAANMYGDRYLPQVKLIPHADLVITHGGNNTVTEVFSQGKPMIVLPLFADQFENAQRLHETGFGVRLDTYGFEEQELISAIDKLLYDEELRQKLEAASERIQASYRHEELADKIEDLLSKC